MSTITLPAPTGNLAVNMQGVWWLLSREDWTKDDERRIDPVLGMKPVGILSYAKMHFAAQFMKKNRSGNEQMQQVHTGHNNTQATDGYDAYFGTYQVDEATGKVAHTLIGSITPSNIGMTVYRDLRANENELIIQLETTTAEDEPITRTLTWKRIS